MSSAALEGALVAASVSTASCFATSELPVDSLIAVVIFAAVLGFVWAGLRSVLTKAAPSNAEAAAVRVEGRGASGLPSPQQVAHLMETRRTITPKDMNGGDVTEEEITSLLRAATWAPTHRLTQPWRFVVLKGEPKEQLEDLTITLCRKYLPPAKLEAAAAKLANKKSKTWPNVSAYIALCFDPHPLGPDKGNPEWEEISALACAVQNMQLLATSMGLAAMWSSWQAAARDAPEFKEFLGQEPHVRCLGLLVLGRTDRDRAADMKAKRLPLEKVVTWKTGGGSSAEAEPAEEGAAGAGAAEAEGEGKVGEAVVATAAVAAEQ